MAQGNEGDEMGSSEMAESGSLAARGERRGWRESVRVRREWAREVGPAWEYGLSALPALAGPGAGR